MTNFQNVSFNQDFLKIIERTEVLNIINNFKDKTAAGFDKLSAKYVKHIAPYIVDPLIFILNLCLKQGIFPDKFKIAIVKPLYKTGNKENISNYRSIDLCFVIFQKFL